MHCELQEPFCIIKRWSSGIFTSKKSLLFLIIALGLILYIGPNVLHWVIRKTTGISSSSGSVAECVETYLEKYLEGDNFDFAAIKSYENGKKFIPYIGNGRLGFSLGDNAMYIYQGRSLSLQFDYNPTVNADISGTDKEDSRAVHFKQGIGYKIQCFSGKQGTVAVISQYFAHRVFPSLLVQIMEIINHSDDHITLNLKRNIPETDLHTLKTGYKDPKRFQYHKLNKYVQIPDTDAKVIVSALSMAVPGVISVEPKKSKTLMIKTVISYSDPVQGPEYESLKIDLEETAKKEFLQALKTSAYTLKKQHVDVWEQLWQSGFSISVSRAQNALNGDKVNATLYYVLSNVREYISEANISTRQLLSVQRHLYVPDKCYSGHHTLQASTLWSDFTSVDDVNNVVSLWLLTLSKQGCQNLIKAGARGVMQAMMLSFGGFKFSNHHLEFDCDPKDLHRDYHFRRIIYGNSTLLNVSVIIQTDNRAIIYASLDKSESDFYGCDGGCLDPPLVLGSEPVKFPVKITEPLTSLLYITPDKSHIQELKHTIHVRGVVEAPAHGHHIIALHRHGHQLGGLPAMFWVSVAFLITIFHLFLAKLIYNEYCANEDKTIKKYVV